MRTIPQHANYFQLLTPAEQAERIKRLASSGFTDSAIGSLTGIGIEGVRRILAQMRESATS
jgi:hypothetical protein